LQTRNRKCDTDLCKLTVGNKDYAQKRIIMRL